MVDFGTTEDLGAMLAELQESIDSGHLTPEQESLHKTFLSLVTVMRDARLAGMSDGITFEALRRAMERVTTDEG